MNWVLIVFGVILAACAAGALWFRTRVGAERALMAATPTSKAAAVASLAPGTVVELKGTLRCQAPLTAEFSQRSCAYHKSEIEREEVYYRRDSQGRSERDTRRTTVHSNTKFAPCWVEDDSGRAAVNLEGATVEGEEAMRRREREQQGVAGTIISIASGGGGADLVYVETILAADIPIYVLGEVQADHSVGKPATGSKNGIFVVSRKSEEERAKSLGSSMLWTLVAAIVLGLIAAGLLVAGLASSG